MFLFLGLTLISIATVASLARYRVERKQLMAASVKQLAAPKGEALEQRKSPHRVSELEHLSVGDVVDDQGHDYEVISQRISSDLNRTFVIHVLDTGATQRLLMIDNTKPSWAFWLREIYALPNVGVLPNSIRVDGQIFQKTIHSFWNHQFIHNIPNELLNSAPQSAYTFYESQLGDIILVEGDPERRTYRLEQVHRELLTVFSAT